MLPLSCLQRFAFPLPCARRLSPSPVRLQGATVEINNVREGATPFRKDYPGVYFHRTLTSIGRRLSASEVLSVLKNFCGTATPTDSQALAGMTLRHRFSDAVKFSGTPVRGFM